jgi:hypothetical protein
VASKAADNAARLAALFHIHEYGPSGEISAAHIHAASRIVTWRLYEAQKFLSGLVLPPTVINAAKLDAWLLHHCGETGASNITTRHAQQYGPLRDKQRLDDAIAGLIDAGRVRLSSEGRQRLIDINPALMRGAD